MNDTVVVRRSGMAGMNLVVKQFAAHTKQCETQGGEQQESEKKFTFIPKHGSHDIRRSRKCQLFNQRLFQPISNETQSFILVFTNQILGVRAAFDHRYFFMRCG